MKFKSAVPKEYEWIVADAVLNQAAPVTGTKYEVLAETKNVRIIGIAIKVTWTVQPTPLELEVIVDGEQMLFSKTDPVTATLYYPKPSSDRAPATFYLDTVDHPLSRAFLFEGKTVTVNVETTGGTVSNLFCRVKYQVKRS